MTATIELDAALHLASDLRAPFVYLLTTTTAGYFPRFGFARIARAEVPSSVQESVEFTAACPASAIRPYSSAI
jgi:N-acetylglutamate synthase-like GNAT family acetyltransferase